VQGELHRQKQIANAPTYTKIGVCRGVSPSSYPVCIQRDKVPAVYETALTIRIASSIMINQFMQVYWNVYNSSIVTGLVAFCKRTTIYGILASRYKRILHLP